MAFKPGQSGNPKGKPRGTKHHATQLAEKLFKGGIEDICAAVVEEAKAGNMAAARIVLDKLIPNAKDRAVELPGMPDTSTAAGVSEAQRLILKAAAAGTLTPGEAATLSGIVEVRRKALETMDIESRITALENRK